MATYQEFRQKTRRRARQRRIRRALALLVGAAAVCLALWGALRLSGWLPAGLARPAQTDLSDPGQSAASDPGQSAVSDPAAEPTPTPAPALPAGEQPAFRETVSAGDLSWNTQTRVAAPTLNMTVASPYAAMVALPAQPLIDAAYFDTVTFIGDSITEGLHSYQTSVFGHSTILGIRSMGPDAVVNGSTVKNRVTGEQLVVLDALEASAPDAVYILLGTNSLVNASQAKEDAFLAYYGKMIDMIRERLLPGVRIYIQSIPPVDPSKTTKLSNEQMNRVNDQLARIAVEKECYFLDLDEVFADEAGNMKADYVQADGIHIKKPAYEAWIDYLARHVAYQRRNVYVEPNPLYIA